MRKEDNLQNPRIAALRPAAFALQLDYSSGRLQGYRKSKMKFLLVCSCGPLNEFRLPELDSIATLYNFPITYLEGSRDTSVSCSL